MKAANHFQKVRLKNRAGFGTKGMRWIYRILYPFFHCRVRIPPEMQESGEPVVFIANHYNVFGPISFVLSMPLVSHIWMNEELIDPESAAVSLRPGMKRLLPFLRDTQVDCLFSLPRCRSPGGTESRRGLCRYRRAEAALHAYPSLRSHRP